LDFINNEVWVSIPGFKYFEASNLGRIRSLDRFDTINDKRGRNFVRKRHGKIHNTFEEKNGYLRTTINDKPKGIHRLVCLAFHGLPKDEKLCVNHKNGIKTDNRPENLEWVSWSENERHSYDVLNKTVWNKDKKYKIDKIRIRDNKNYEENCRKSYEMFKNGIKIAEIAKVMNMSTTCIRIRIRKYTLKTQTKS